MHSLVFGAKLRRFEFFVITGRGEHASIITARMGLRSGFAHQRKREAVTQTMQEFSCMSLRADFIGSYKNNCGKVFVKA